MQVTGIFCRKHYINLVHKPVASVSMRSPVEYSHPAFSQMAVQASCGRPLVKENCLIFHMLLTLEHIFGRLLLKKIVLLFKCWFPYSTFLDAHFANLG